MLALTVLSATAPSVAGTGSTSSLQAEGVLITDCVMMIVQGENDVTAGSESDHEFYVLKIMSFEVPYNATRVHSNIPRDAREVSAWTSAYALNESAYGWESSGSNEDEFYIDLPETFDRGGDSFNTTDEQKDFLAQGSYLEDLMFTAGHLNLSANASSGTFVSAPMPLAEIHSIESANLTVYGTDLDNVTAFLSNDNGTTWTRANQSAEVHFAVVGTTLKVMLELTGNLSQGYDPTVTKFEVSSRYIEASTGFTVHMSYMWTGIFENRTATIDLSEPLDYSADGTVVVMLYLVDGFALQSSGLSFVFDESGSMSSYPDKNLYLSSLNVSGPGPTVTLSITAPEAQTPWLLYLGVAALAGTFVVGMVCSIRNRRGKSVPSVEAQSGPSDEVIPAPLSEDDLERRKELVARKKQLLGEMAEAKSDLSSGKRGKEQAGKDLQKLKAEFKSVRSELARLDRRAESSPGAPVAIEPSGEYDAALGAVARVDEDFEKGRLPEATYKSLRKEYVAKAAALLEAKRAAERATSPLEAEKTKLLEAISTLDAEHDNGEIDEKVYADLSASYRRELAELMKKMDDTEKEA